MSPWSHQMAVLQTSSQPLDTVSKGKDTGENLQVVICAPKRRQCSDLQSSKGGADFPSKSFQDWRKLHTWVSGVSGLASPASSEQRFPENHSSWSVCGGGCLQSSRQNPARPGRTPRASLALALSPWLAPCAGPRCRSSAFSSTCPHSHFKVQNSQ